MAATKDMLVDWQSLLKSLPALTNKVGNRIYSGQAPQGVPLPTLIWNIIAAPSDYTHDGHALEEVLIQFDMDGTTQTQCREVADALRGGLSGKRSQQSVTDFEAIFHDGNEFTTVNESVTEGTTQTHRLTIDYRILWRPSLASSSELTDLEASVINGMITLTASGGRYTWPATGPAGSYSGPYTVSVTNGMMAWNWGGNVFTHPVSGSTPSATGAFTATASGGMLTGIVGVTPYTWPAALI